MREIFTLDVLFRKFTYKFNTYKSVCYMKTHQKEPKAEN